MDGKEEDKESLISRIEQLQHERDDLRKDIEQLCLQQAGPGYLAVATRMHFQRTAALEQDIESLKRKLSGLARDKHNLQEELSEAYRIKAQLAELHSAEVLKNKEADKQVKFFQNCVAAAFSERDHSLMEFEKAKEREESMSQKLVDSENRLTELEESFLNAKILNAALEAELREIKGQSQSFEKVVNKFCEIRDRDTRDSTGETWKERCSCLLDDPSEKWIFNSDSITSASKYIVSLEKELEARKNKIDKLQTNLRMGLEIEQHLKGNVQSLWKKQIILDDVIRSGLSTLHNFHNQQKSEILKILEEEKSQMNTLIFEVQKKMSQIQIIDDIKSEENLRENCDDTECRDVHVSVDAESCAESKENGLCIAASTIKSITPDSSDTFAQALQEKVSALLLLSQQEERHLLESDVNAALRKKIEELQRNLSQVTNEKVKALLQLAQLNKEYQLLLENSNYGSKHKDLLADGLKGSIMVQEKEGKLKNILKRSYIGKWMGKELSEHETDFHGGTDESASINKINYSSMEFARLKVENVALQESMTNMEHLTSSIHKLHVSLLKAQEDTLSAVATDSIIGALNGIIQEANHIKTALGSSLPVSWSGDSTDAITYDSLYEATDDLREASKSERLGAVSAAGFEMVELLILAARLLKEHLIDRKSSASQM